MPAAAKKIYLTQVSGGVADFGRKVYIRPNLGVISSSFSKITSLYLSCKIWEDENENKPLFTDLPGNIIKDIKWEIAGKYTLHKSGNELSLFQTFDCGLGMTRTYEEEKNRMWVKLPWIDDIDWFSLNCDLGLCIAFQSRDSAKELLNRENNIWIDCHMIIEGYEK